ncbi:MAG: CHAT domain-containing protein [Calothrix sp. C42_A2020_038]|nr:CHAT domain-containing protein [Calothrix sp. C42_A2020_038]
MSNRKIFQINLPSKIEFIKFKNYLRANYIIIRVFFLFCLGILAFGLVVSLTPALASGYPSHLLVQIVERDSNLNAQNAKSFLHEGRIRFDAGQFSEAIHIWQQAVANFERQGDTVNQAWSLSYLSLAYQNLGEWQKAQAAINASLKVLHYPNTKQTINYLILAVVLNTQGSLNISTGQPEAALKSWQEAERAYVAANDKEGQIGSKINQAQALQALGLYRRAKELLTEVNNQLVKQQNLPLKLKALRSLGVALQVVGDLQKAQEVLEQSLNISYKLGLVADTSEILFSLGNTKRSLQDTQAALEYYQKAVVTAINPRVKVEALLNQLSIYVDVSETEKALLLVPQIKSLLSNLPISRMSVYAKVNFATSLKQLPQKQKRESGEILARAIYEAESLGDLRAKSYALNELGKLYESSGQLEAALKLSTDALRISQAIHAPDITYQATWQVGRLNKIQGNIEGAYSAYNTSLEILKSLRSDLVAINSDIQFSFQESVEPVYREFVALLLQSNPSQANLKKAREVIEALQLAELDNFFREACIDAKPQQIDKIDQQAAIIYPIILPDRLEVILSMPGGEELSSYRTIIGQTEIEDTIKLMRQSLNPAFSKALRLQVAQQIYNWLIQPGESQWEHRGIKTLVFVLDGSLRNIPMAALHDGKQYLLEKYNIALSPGLQIIPSQSVKNRRLKVIAAGLSEANQGFKALPGVKLEVTKISSQLSTKLLLNEKFTDSNLKNIIKSTPFSILHFATHAQFSSKSDDTYIITWNGKINVKQLDELLEVRSEPESTPVDLIVLSACQTAKGDNRAILGLAGVAVRSGARSTVATLWAVQDESTAKFMVEFYKQLGTPVTTKAQALRNTQLMFLKDKDFSHPFYWAPFVLIGNWL